MAPAFNRRRHLPDGVPESIRDAVLRTLPDHPEILDLGAGAGRIGLPFVASGDSYTGTDLSLGMLQAFAEQAPTACLTQADGKNLPFPDAAFDAVLLIQVLSGVPGWRHLLTETLRVLRPAGKLIVGRVVAPDDGIDAKLKDRLAEILSDMGIHPYRDKPRDDAMSWLARTMPDPVAIDAATWTAHRTPSAFVDRHGTGARFSVLPEPVKQAAMQRLTAWATDRFGPLDNPFPEQHRFELTIHSLQPGTTH